MKIRLLVLSFLLFFFTGCNKHKGYWNIRFKTSSTNGICYYINNEPVYTNSGELALQNISNIPIHIYIYNDTVNGKLEYEADLDLGGILFYPNLDKDSKYTIGVRVLDGKGQQYVNVLVYNDFNLLKENNL